MKTTSFSLEKDVQDEILFQRSRPLDRRPAKDEAPSVQPRFATTSLAILVIALSTGCGTLLRLGGPPPSAITFEDGVLRTTEDFPLATLDLACRRAVEILGYEEVEATHEVDRVRWTARTAGGDPVELQLTASRSKRTELRIRIGVLGDEARSRLVLEQIHQSL